MEHRSKFRDFGEKKELFSVFVYEPKQIIWHDIKRVKLSEEEGGFYEFPKGIDYLTRVLCVVESRCAEKPENPWRVLSECRIGLGDVVLQRMDSKECEIGSAEPPKMVLGENSWSVILSLPFFFAKEVAGALPVHEMSREPLRLGSRGPARTSD